MDGANSVRKIDLLHLHSEIEMKEKTKYKRYMVFTWSEYDNVKPFDTVYDSFDSVDDAKKCTEGEEESWIFRKDEEGENLFCIFDRFKGVMVE